MSAEIPFNHTRKAFEDARVDRVGDELSEEDSQQIVGGDRVEVLKKAALRRQLADATGLPTALVGEALEVIRRSDTAER